MDVLQPIIKPYSWGSRDALARLQGRDVPAAGPEAELWMGAHPAGPSGLTRDGRRTTLQDVVAADPERELGAPCARRFGGRLPFLLKILAADRPLSIQVHPDRRHARSGFAAQSAAPGRQLYADDWPKPELLYALTPFEVLAGFRGRAEAVEVYDGLGVPALGPVVDVLRAGDADDALREALRTVLDRPSDDRRSLVSAVVAASARLGGSPGPYAAAYAAVAGMARHHPGDPGLVASLLLRHQVLEAGTALFMPAGGLHAYVRGVGVELLANSDNVLRAGLTGKEVDVPELLRITDPGARVAVVAPRPLGGPGRTHAYDCPVEEFALHRTALGAAPRPVVPAAGPRIVLCLDGTAQLGKPDGEEVSLRSGASCFLPATDEEVTARGDGTLFVASAGTPLLQQAD
ncbi:mannose-6-phosphate isomerase, class I [Streptomyces longwoodensis]|uniref:mannose-6-phosphate isomerase, class I n=1 Tax=Streptomyces longwoodensis TaxID=68231 RepID=UPI0036E8F182